MWKCHAGQRVGEAAAKTVELFFPWCKKEAKHCWKQGLGCYPAQEAVCLLQTEVVPAAHHVLREAVPPVLGYTKKSCVPKQRLRR